MKEEFVQFVRGIYRMSGRVVYVFKHSVDIIGLFSLAVFDSLQKYIFFPPLLISYIGTIKQT